MVLNPIGERYIVKRITEERIGRIIMPSNIQKSSFIGEIIHAGPDCNLEVGTKVLFARYSGYELPLDAAAAIDKEVYANTLVMNESDLIASIEEEK